MIHRLEVGRSYLASVARAGTGSFPRGAGARPAEALELYEFELCPFCRKAREALSALELDVLVRPCPKNGPRYRPWVTEQGGRASFPYLVDPGRGVRLYESSDIVSYLYDQYGNGAPPLALGLGPLTMVSSNLASLWRAPRGLLFRGKVQPDQPLELWAHEAGPRCRLVREILCELEIPYLLHNVPLGSPRRAELQRRFGSATLPVLLDPNTGSEHRGSAETIRYLNRRYG